MKLVTEYGFGIVVEELKFKPNYVSLLMTHLATHERREEYMEFCKDEDLAPGDADSFEAYCDYAFRDYAYTRETCLAKMFSEKYSLSENNEFKCEDWCIYYPERIPEDEKEQQTMLNKQQIRKMIAEFFNVIVEETPMPKSLEIQY